MLRMTTDGSFHLIPHYSWSQLDCIRDAPVLWWLRASDGCTSGATNGNFYVE